MPVIEAVRKSKGQMLAKLIEQDIRGNKLIGGTRLDSIRNMAAKYSVSPKSIQAAFELLEKRNVIEIIPYSGVYVKEDRTLVQKTCTMKLLTLVANMNLVPLPSREIFMNLQNGILSKLKPDVKLELLPATLDNTQNTLNADSIEPNDIVVVYSGWFEPLFPILEEKKCKVIYIDTGYLHEPYRDIIKQWSRIEVMLSQEYEKMVGHLHAAGKKRIVYCGPYFPPVDKTSKYSNWKSLKDALTSYGIYFEDFYHECESSLGIGRLQKDELRQFLIKLHSKLNFDAIIAPYPLILEAIDIIQSDLKLSIPDDVAFVCCNVDYSAFEHMTPTVSALNIPWYEIGREVAAMFADIDNYPVNVRFASEMKVRQSSSRNSVTELRTEQLNMDYHLFNY